MKLLGIDDAGRGPVIGPMVLAGILIDKKEEDTLKDLGVKDSKLLLPTKRNQIGEKLKDFKYHIEITQPIEIDESPNLNHLEAIKMAMIINKLTKDETEKTKVIIDCPSVNIKSWQEFLEKLIEKKQNLEILCEHKADLNHVVVSAASILAKEKREKEMAELREKIKIDLGSGYPGDPKTKEFLEKSWDNNTHKEIIRHSWQTVKKLKKQRAQKKLF